MKAEIIMIVLTIVLVSAITLLVLSQYEPNPILIGRDVLNNCTNPDFMTGNCIIK